MSRRITLEEVLERQQSRAREAWRPPLYGPAELHAQAVERIAAAARLPRPRPAADEGPSHNTTAAALAGATAVTTADA